jgi:ABC-type nitrate/sulfonate/bicarbonate transport system ATPase subunit
MSPRPGRVKAIVPVDIPRPRPASARRDPQMFEVEAAIGALMEHDAAVPA